ncbi:MAG: hypothetical protein Kow0069_04240 [Promethearchaeota archaeon]
MSTFCCERFEFEARLPEGWAAKESDVSVVFKPAADEFGPSLVVTPVTGVPPELSLHRGGIEFFKAAIEREVVDAEFGNEEKFFVDGVEAVAFNVGYAYVTGDGNVAPVAKMQVYLKWGDRVVSITGTTTPDDFEARYPTFRDFVLSFRFR